MLTPAQRTFLKHEHTIAPAVFNLVLNALLAWLLFRKHAPVPLFGDPSITNDVIGTLFFLPLLTGLVATPLTRRAAMAGKVAPLSITAREHWLLRYLPKATWLRAMVVAFACVVLFAPPVILLFKAFGVEQLSLAAAVPLKGAFAAILAALVSPVFALYALARSEAA